jgi:hypothetical protein
MSVTLICYCYDPPAWELGIGPTTCHSKIQHITKYMVHGTGSNFILGNIFMELIVSSESHIKFNAKMNKLAHILRKYLFWISAKTLWPLMWFSQFLQGSASTLFHFLSNPLLITHPSVRYCIAWSRQHHYINQK